jgi:hypothetical protein
MKSAVLLCSAKEQKKLLSTIIPHCKNKNIRKLMQAQKIVKLLLRDKADDESREHTETQ